MLAPTPVVELENGRNDARTGAEHVDQAAGSVGNNVMACRQDHDDAAETEQSASADNKDDDDVTVIVLDQAADDSNGHRLTIAWTGETGPQVEERRRAIMLRELERVQRTSFMHFVILCLIPTVLLFIVIATVIGEDEVCYSEATICHKEERSFINAFTTRCICEAIAVPRSG